MKIVKAAIGEIKKYRTDYLNSLPEFQELFIELMLSNCDCYLLHSDDKETGYTIINADNILIEFYVRNNYISGSNEIFRQVVKDLSVTGVYCKSFDSLLLSSCLLSSFQYSVIGLLYRDYVEPLIMIDSGIKMNKADSSSVGLFKKQDESIKVLFDTEEQLTNFINNEHVFEFYKNDEFVGCGMIIRTHSDYNFCDLGVWVNPLKRGKYIGSQIVLNLRDFAMKNNMIPSCGCAIENLASQKMIEKSGYVSRYKMINFQTK